MEEEVRTLTAVYNIIYNISSAVFVVEEEVRTLTAVYNIIYNISSAVFVTEEVWTLTAVLAPGP